MKLENIYIYRMTHIDNIPNIMQNGITHKNSPNSNPNFIPIGDVSLIDTRSSKRVSIDNGEMFDFDMPAITLGDFIPFYFGIKMPMLYVIQNGGNFVEKATPAEKIIYLACPINNIIQSGGVYYFSDGHATDNLTSFYDSSKINELPNIIDWDSIKAPFWGGQENLNIKRKKQAELLVSDDLPSQFIAGFCCYNDDAKESLVNIGIDETKIKVIPRAYY
ncbi:MAG: type II toxin-antitoxin system toxin DNA ADP-ribosyl transferase DarT [Mesonia hippocampi]|uniref:type II toxin-antitoxin system toxin DNA ADP-ribosyl transferase DarT n=2 Tax=Mesonia hippocampi TaxID=1628250 RepID=UPI003F9E0936